MIWADTNILLRLITKTPVHQLEAIKQFLKAAVAPVLVHPAHICEALYVLEGQVYKFSTARAAQDIAMLLSSDRFEVIDALAVTNALSAYPASNLDFPDVLICELARVGGGQVLTFDRKMAQLGVALVSP